MNHVPGEYRSRGSAAVRDSGPEVSGWIPDAFSVAFQEWKLADCPRSAMDFLRGRPETGNSNFRWTEKQGRFNLYHLDLGLFLPGVLVGSNRVPITSFRGPLLLTVFFRGSCSNTLRYNCPTHNLYYVKLNQDPCNGGLEAIRPIVKAPFRITAHLQPIANGPNQTLRPARAP
jgi:hypothetical protein